MESDSDRDFEDRTVFPKDFDLPGEAPPRSDEEIKQDIESALFYDDLVSSYSIQVDVSQGVVKLSGAVTDDMERDRAAEDARKVPGVKEVINNIQLSQEARR